MTFLLSKGKAFEKVAENGNFQHILTVLPCATFSKASQLHGEIFVVLLHLLLLTISLPTS